jgi:uncharacterized SAM-binding protein YcdF (DUF218 family)
MSDRVAVGPDAGAATRPQPPGRRGRRARRAIATVVGTLLALVLLIPLVTAGAIWWTARQDQRPASDAILVMGAAQFDGTPSKIFSARLDHAASLYAKGIAPAVVTVGGKQDGDRFTEAEAGAAYLVKQGVPAEAIVVVGEGADSLSSLEAAAPVLAERGIGSLVLVTDPWHSFRSAQMARDLGLEVATSPARSGPAVATREVQARYMMRETAAYSWYRLFGASPEDGPQAL